MPRPLVSRLLALGTTVLTCTALLTTTAAPAGAVTPRTPSGLPVAIESPTDYVGQVSCDPRIRPGTAKLARLLAATYPAGRNWASTYACGTDGNRSEHYDGRAIDWMVDVHNKAQLTAARSAINWLLATDAAGNRFAMARRLGVMYVIYNNRMWGAWSGQWEDYNGCAKLAGRGNDNACHRTHMHISLSWNGAMGRTSFWTKRLAPEDYGPCRVAGLNWAPRYTGANLLGCPDVARPQAGSKASATRKAVVKYSGAALGAGAKGPAVSAVQRALRVPATGTYNAATVKAVRTFQARRHVPVSGSMTTATWLALLPLVK